MYGMNNPATTESSPAQQGGNYNVTFYLAYTSEWRWGSGKTKEEALKNACAVGRTGKIKRGICVRVYKNIQTEEHQYRHIAEDARRSHITLTGYDPNDHVMPFVGSWGNVIAWGTLEKLFDNYPEE
jgi:hypothetical protein